MDCSICCSPYTKTLRKQVQCPYCQYTCCQVCLRQYFLTIQDEPNCISCHKIFSQDHKVELVGSHYLNHVYRKHREALLFERERAMLPDTQGLVQSTLELRNLTTINKETEKELKEMRRRINQMVRTYEQNRRRINTLNYYIQRGEVPPEHPVHNEQKERRIFIRPCPAPECRGFLNDIYQCGTCHTKVCSKCHEITDTGTDTDTSTNETPTEHVCHPDNVASAKAILKDTRPCPKCAVPIYKIDGCSQMWCSACKTAFDWNTGEIERGRIHNPHYYEWLREQNHGNAPREQGDVECGGIPDVMDVIRWIQTKHALVGNNFRCTEWNAHRNHHKDFTWLENRILHIHRKMIHIHEMDMRRYDTRNENNADIRIKYLLKEYTDDEFRKQLFLREKVVHKKHAIYQILELFVMAVSDILRNYIAVPPKPNSPEKMYAELIQISRHCNDNIKQICERYKCVVPKLLELE